MTWQLNYSIETHWAKKSKDKEIKFVKDQRQKAENMGGGMPDLGLNEDELGELGAELGGNANNEHNLVNAKGDTFNKVANEL